MRVALIAYGHADNVLCLSNNLSRYADVTLIFVMSGDRFTRSILDWDISKLPYGLTTCHSVINGYLGRKLRSYVNEKLRILLVRTPSLSLVRTGAYGNLKYIRQVAKYVRGARFDVVHFNGSSGFQLYFQYFLRHMPRALTIHDYLPHSGEGTRRRNLMNTALNWFYTKSKYQFIQHYQFLSERFAGFYGLQPSRVSTVYCGPLEVYRSFTERGVKEESSTVLFFGRISPYKGIKYLVDAARLLRKRVGDVKIIIAGHGEFSSELDIDDPLFEIRNYHIPNEELVELIQRATIIVAPYTDATHSAVIMTAYAFHKPLVATAVGGIPEVVADNVTGRLVPPRDPGALADALTDLLQHRGKREKMSENIERLGTLGDFSWDSIAKNTIAVYESAIENNQ